MHTIFTAEYIKNLASLAKITIDDQELPRYANQLNGIIDMMGLLDSIDTSNTKPMYSVSEDDSNSSHNALETNISVSEQNASADCSAPHNMTRDDTPLKNTSTEAVLSNAPKIKQQYFVVPNAIE